MYATFYTVTDAPNVLNKTLDNGHTTNCEPVEPCDFLNPVLVMNKHSDVMTANYVSISSPLNRKYFITGKSLLSGNRVMITCAVDVLTTYADSIKECFGTFTRSEHPKNKYIKDNKYPLTCDMLSKSALFPKTPFTAANGRNYILTVVGGGNNGN